MWTSEAMGFSCELLKPRISAVNFRSQILLLFLCSHREVRRLTADDDLRMPINDSEPLVTVSTDSNTTFKTASLIAVLGKHFLPLLSLVSNS